MIFVQNSPELVHDSTLFSILVTNSADFVILPDNPDPENKKQVVIPAHKDLMIMLPYFRAQLNKGSDWKELRSKTMLEVTVPLKVDPKAVFSFVESIYDKKLKPLTQENCIDILKLSIFWCDDFMIEQSKHFIADNLNAEMCQVICSDFEISHHLQNLMTEVFKCAFSSNRKYDGMD